MQSHQTPEDPKNPEDNIALWSILSGRPATAADLHEIDNSVVPLIQLLLDLQPAQPDPPSTDASSGGSDVE